jgi:hypothetical protein
MLKNQVAHFLACDLVAVVAVVSLCDHDGLYWIGLADATV